MTNSTPVPVTLITGFLGSGKTTLLNRLLDEGALKDAALIINEFGDVGIDHLLVESADEGIVELSDGCLCCTIRGDLVDTLTRLLNRERADNSQNLSRIVIETTGLADPAPILHAVMGHPVLCDLLRLDGVVTLVDAVNGSSTLDNHEEAIKQVAVADRLVITKSDLTGDIAPLLARLKRLNPTAQTFIEQPKAADLFNCGLYDPQTKTANVSSWLNDEALAEARLDHHHHHDTNRHDARIRAFTLKSDQAVDAPTLATFIDLLRSAHGPNLLRVKGIIKLKEDPDRPVVLHGVQEVFHPPATLPAWPDEDHSTRLVMITRDLSKAFVEKLFDALMGNVRSDTPDKVALENNPLAIPGFSPSSKTQ